MAIKTKAIVLGNINYKERQAGRFIHTRRRATARVNERS